MNSSFIPDILFLIFLTLFLSFIAMYFNLPYGIVCFACLFIGMLYGKMGSLFVTID